MPKIPVTMSQTSRTEFLTPRSRGLRRSDERINKLAISLFCGIIGMSCLALSIISPVFMIPGTFCLLVALGFLGIGGSKPRNHRTVIVEKMPPYRTYGQAVPVVVRHGEPPRAAVGTKAHGVFKMPVSRPSVPTDPLGRPIQQGVVVKKVVKGPVRSAPPGLGNVRTVPITTQKVVTTAPSAIVPPPLEQRRAPVGRK